MFQRFMFLIGKRKMIIRGYEGRNLLFFSYENPARTFLGKIIGIDRIEVTFESSNGSTK